MIEREEQWISSQSDESWFSFFSFLLWWFESKKFSFLKKNKRSIWVWGFCNISWFNDRFVYRIYFWDDHVLFLDGICI